MRRFSQPPVLFIALTSILAVAAWLVLRSRTPSHLEAAERAIEQRDFRAARRHLDFHLKSVSRDPDATLLAARTARRDDDGQACTRLLAEHEAMVGRTEPSETERRLLAIQRGNRKLTAEALASCRAEPDPQQRALVLEAILEGTLNRLAEPYSEHRPIPPQDLEGTPVPHARDAIALWFERALSEPDRVQGYVWRARLREICGEHEAALADLRAALAIDPVHRHANFLAALFRTEESPGESLAILNKLCEQEPENGRFAMARSLALRSAGRLEDARAALDRLLEREPESIDALLARGRVALDLGNPAEAEPFLRKALTEALSVAPTSTEVHAIMERCMRQMNRPEEAAKHRERFLELERERQSPK